MFSNRVLKAGTVAVDTDNKVIIGDEVQIEEDLQDDTVEEKPVTSTIDIAKIEAKAKRIITQANDQAELILADARTAAISERDSVIKKAESDATRITAEARDAGYQEGINSAVKEGETIKAQANKVLDDAHAERNEMLETLEPELVQLIMEICDKLLGTATYFNPAIIVNLIKQGLEGATISGDVKIYVSTHDYEAAMQNKDEILALTDGSVKLEIVKDLSLNPADCVIETPFGSIDASLGQQFEALTENLAYILSNR